MSYMTATQVKNILAQKGFPRGKKLSSTNSPTGGVVTLPQDDGWVQVAYSNSSLAAKDNVSSEIHNAQMHYLIHFALMNMSEFEFKLIEKDIYGHYKSREYLYRKAK
jgi:hypothetical protein